MRLTCSHRCCRVSSVVQGVCSTSHAVRSTPASLPLMSSHSSGVGGGSVMHAATAAPTAALSPSDVLAGKIDALDEERKEIKGKINAIEEKINAIEGKIEAADAAHDAAAAATLRAERQEAKGDMKQLRSLLLALQQEKTAKEQQHAEYQHKENLLLEAQQRAQQSSFSGQFGRHRMQVTADAYVHSLTLALRLAGIVFVAYQRSTPAYCAPCSQRRSLL